jgi:hypothetical protein
MVLEVATVVVLLPSIIWEAISPVPASVYFLQVSLVFFLIFEAFLSAYAGYKSRKN